MKIIPGNFADEQVIALLRAHVTAARANSPPGTSFALDLSGLQKPDISFYTAWDGKTLVGMGALKQLNAEAGEIKSMRTKEDALRRGVGRAMLEHIIAEARARGMKRLSLETGTGPIYAPAQAFYRAHGFAPGEPFGGYPPDGAFNAFFHLDL
jgi:putative acetyltransferase